MSTFTMATLESVRGEIFHSKYYLNIRSGYMAPVTLHCSYGDSGETVSFYIFDGTEKLDLTSAVASVHGTRIDGADFGPFACTISDGNKVSFALDSAMTAVEGSAIAEIVITSGGATIGTCNFGILIENAVFPNGVAYDNDPAVYQNILKYVQTMTANTKSELRAEYLGKISTEASARQSADTTINNTINTLTQRVNTAISGVTTDTEVTDIRTGYKAGGESTTTYTTAGTAVRTQIKDLWDVVNMAGAETEQITPAKLGTGGNMTPNNRVHYYGAKDGSTGLIKANKGDIFTWTDPKKTSFTSQISFTVIRDGTYAYAEEEFGSGWLASPATWECPVDGYVSIAVSPTTGSGAYTDMSQGGFVYRKFSVVSSMIRKFGTVLTDPILSAGGNMTANNRLIFGPYQFTEGDIIYCTEKDGFRFSVEERLTSLRTSTLLASTNWSTYNAYTIKYTGSYVYVILAMETDSQAFSSVKDGLNTVYVIRNGGSSGGSSSGNDILSRNADIMQNVFSSSYYGHPENWTANANKQFSMLVTTDVHADKTRFSSAINYLNGIGSIDAGICLGDIVGGNFSEDKTWYSTYVLQSSKPFYTVIGNHDGGNSASKSISATKAEQLAAFITPTVSKIGITPTNTYYAITNDTYKVVIIILDCYDVPDTLNGSDFKYSRGLNAYSQAQVSWLVSTLGSVAADYSVMICQHCQYDNQTKVNCLWSSNLDRDFRSSSYTPGSTETHQYESMIPDIVNAWKNRTSISKSYAPVTSGLPTISVSADFSGLSDPGKFAGYFIGHTHSDTYTYITKYPDQLVFNFDCTANDLGQPTWSDLPRVTGTKSEDCITVVTIDNSTDTVRLVRVGSNITTDMRNRTMFISKFDQAVTS